MDEATLDSIECLRKLKLFNRFGGLQTISHEGFGKQELRILRMELNFLAKAINKHAQIFTFVDVFKTPNLHQQFTVGNGTIAIVRKIKKQIALRCR